MQPLEEAVRLFLLMVLFRIELRASHMLGKGSCMELYPSPWSSRCFLQNQPQSPYPSQASLSLVKWRLNSLTRDKTKPFRR